MVRRRHRIPGGPGMKERIERMLARFGRAVMLHKSDGTGASAIGLLEPVTSKSMQAMQKEIPGAGVIPPGQHLYIGRAGEALDAVEYMTVGDGTYLIRRWDKVYYQDKAVFLWALCVKSGEEEAWT